MNCLLRWAIGIAALLALISGALGQPLSVTFSPVFEGDTSGPTKVSIQNRGAARRGEITAQTYDSSLVFPVEIPASSSKEVIVYSQDNYTYQPIRFRSGGFMAEAPMPGYGDGGNISAVVIHEEPAGITKLNLGHGMAQIRGKLCPCLPEDAPERAAAYGDYFAVWLGGGCERLSESQVLALKAYLVGGGTLVFSGGSHSGALRDARWADILGIKAGSLTNRSAALLDGLTPVTFGAVEISRPKWPGSLFGGFGAYRPVGGGRVIVLSCSFFDPAFEASGTSSRLCAKVLSTSLRNGTPNRKLDSGDPNPASGGAPPYGRSSRPEESTSDAFSYQPPESGALFGGVWLFALLLAPLAILVPRWMKRAELAWILTPLAAVIVAAFVMSGQGALRAAKLAQRTTGFAYIHEGADPAVLYAVTDIFIPRAGRYDLKMEPTELASIEGGVGRGGGDSTVIDVGAAILPPISAKNLEFRTIRYETILSGMGGWLHCEAAPGHKMIRVTNRSPYELTQLQVEGVASKGPLAPGKSLVLDARRAKEPFPMIRFAVEDLPVGPELGRDKQLITCYYQLRSSPW